MFSIFVTFFKALIVSVSDDIFNFSFTSFTSFLKQNQDVFVDGMSTFVNALAIALLVFMATKQGLSIYVTQTDGDADQDPMEFVTRIFIAVATIAANSFIYRFLYRFTAALTSDVMDRITTTAINDVIETGAEAMGSSISNTSGIFASSVLMAVIEIAFFVFMIRGAIMAAELCMMHLLLPLFAIDLITTNKERWNNFMTGYVTTFVSWSFQILCVGGLIAVLSSSGGFIWTIGWIVMCFRAPKFLQKFTYTSGVGRFVTGSARSAMYVVPQLIRR